MAIKTCPCCNKPPSVKIIVKCENEKCLMFGEEYYVYDWQKLPTFSTEKFEEIFQA